MQLLDFANHIMLWKTDGETFCSTKLFLFYIAPTIFFTLTAIKNIAKDKTVYKESPPSAKGSNDISVIVDGDRNGKITATPNDPDDTTNSKVNCTACYISTSTNVNMWIRIKLIDKYFITGVKLFTGKLVVNEKIPVVFFSEPYFLLFCEKLSMHAVYLKIYARE